MATPWFYPLVERGVYVIDVESCIPKMDSATQHANRAVEAVPSDAGVLVFTEASKIIRRNAVDSFIFKVSNIQGLDPQAEIVRLRTTRLDSDPSLIDFPQGPEVVLELRVRKANPKLAITAMIIGLIAAAIGVTVFTGGNIDLGLLFIALGVLLPAYGYYLWSGKILWFK